jgi:hypothetical protein
MVAPDAGRTPEVVLNERLRRMDWRFLLPDERPRRAVCFGDARLAGDLGAIVQEVIEGQGAEGCELAVAVDPSPAALASAFQSLEPGGSCYSEWYAFRPGSVRRVRRTLERAGFFAIECYWPWPPPRRGAPRVWLPLEAPTAIKGYLASRRPGLSTWPRLIRKVFDTSWRFAFRFNLLSPVCAVARKPGGARPDGIRPTVEARWGSLGFGERPLRLAWLLVAPGPRTISKLIAFVFADGDSSAQLIVKIARVPAAAQALEREAASLEAVARARPSVQGVPRALIGVPQGTQLRALGLSPMPGAPLYTVLTRRRYRRLALPVTDWLVGLAGSVEPVGPEAWWDRLVEPVLGRFERSFVDVATERDLAETREILSTLPALPVIPEQRDCSPWNVLVDERGRLSVLDWESAELCGLPALDLVYFLAYAGFFLDGAMDSRRFLESYRRTRDPATATGAVARECERRYVAALGVEGSVLRPLRLLAWLVHTSSDYEQILADTHTGAAPRLDESLFVALWREELRAGD